MSKITQLHEIAPDELTKTILDGVEKRISELQKNFQPKEPPKYLTRQQAADCLQISTVCLHDWINKGYLKSYKLGNRTYFRQDEIQRAVEGDKPNKHEQRPTITRLGLTYGDIIDVVSEWYNTMTEDIFQNADGLELDEYIELGIGDHD